MQLGCMSHQLSWVMNTNGPMGFCSSNYTLEQIIPSLRQSFGDVGINLILEKLSENEAFIRIEGKTVRGTIIFKKTEMADGLFWDKIDEKGNMTGGASVSSGYDIQSDFFYYDRRDMDIYNKSLLS